MNDREFIGRHEQLEVFNEFLNSDVQSEGVKGTYARLLLVVGYPGMGKKALLQKMKEQADKQGHYCFFLDKINNENYRPMIQKLIEVVRKKKRPPLVHWTEVAELATAAASSIPAAPAGNIGNAVLKIIKRHKAAKQGDNPLAWMLREKLENLSKKIPDISRIVVFLYPEENPLNPEEENPKELIPLLNSIGKDVPEKVRFVIAQRPHSVVVNTVDSGEADENLINMYAEPVQVKTMEKEESEAFIRQYDTGHILNEATTKVFLEIYGGWPRLMKLALEELEKEPGEITEETIRNLPEYIDEFWKRRYYKIDKNEERNFVQTISLLPHPYKNIDVELFCDLDPEEMDKVYVKLPPVSRLIEEQVYEDPLSGENWGECPQAIHATAKEYVINELRKGNKRLYYQRLDAIASHYNDKIGNNFGKADKDTLTYLFTYLMNAKKWDEIGKLLAKIEYLKKKQEPEEQYKFQDEFVNLLNSEIPDDKLKNVLEGVLEAIKQMPDGNKKADWLDIFAYWINKFGVEPKTKRSPKLKDIAIQFDEECGKISKRLVDSYEKKKEHDWAMRYAELRTWVYQRAGKFGECIEASEDAEKMSLQGGMDEAYRRLGQAEFIRIRAHAFMKLFEETKETKYKDSARKVYEELTKVFPADGGESQWPGIKEWDEIEEHLMTETYKVLPTPSQAGPDQPGAFKAQVVSNLDDCIGAMHIIQFLEKQGGRVEWIHHKQFETERFAPEDTLFTVLVGGPKAPGISNVAYEFYKDDKKNFLRMYSGLYPEANRLYINKDNTHCFMLGGISKIHTLMAAYEFTKFDKVKQIIKKGQPSKE